MVAAALLTAGAMSGCSLPNGLPEPSDPTPSAVPHPPAVVAPPPAVDRPPLSPPLEVPMPPVPTVQGPYVPPPAPTASAPPASAPPAASETPVPPPSPTPTATPVPSPEPPPLSDLLPAAAALPPLTWSDAEGEHAAEWTLAAPAAPVEAATAITHVAAAMQAGGSCGAAAERVVVGALDAAATSLAAEPAPGAPFGVVLVRYPSSAAADDALAALRLLGEACEGADTGAGVLGAGEGAHGATVLLRDGDVAHAAEAIAIDALLAAVLHESAPPEAVATLLSAIR